jgi:arylsulfatase A-like enzyme
VKILGRCLLALVAAAAARAQSPPNVLMIVADDLGVDRVGCYHEHPDPGHTPVIDGLAAKGLLFRRAWAEPVCSPSRASILLGQDPFRHGIGQGLDQVADTLEMWTGDTTLPDALAPDYTSVAFGKWHLSVDDFDSLHHPLKAGFAHFLGNLTIFPGFISDGYYDFPKLVDGVLGESTTYNTTDIVNDALAMLPTLHEPWFSWLSFNAPHAPFHKPPANLHTFDLPPTVQADVPMHMKAMTEAMDTEIGRLLSTLDPALLARTIIIFVGDNGTDKPATTAPWLPSHAKGTIYDGGLRVPLIVVGPGVAVGAECQALVNITDLFATVAELAGKPHATATDSVSFVPYFSNPALPSLRNTLRAEIFEPEGFGPFTRHDVAARDGHFKLLRFWTPSATHEELYDLWADSFELNDLLAAPLSPEAAAAYAVLEPALFPKAETWNEVGEGIVSAHGEAHLSGSGPLTPGSLFSIHLTAAAPLKPMFLVIGWNWAGKLKKGGVLDPTTDFALTTLFTDALGQLNGSAPWPAGLPSQFRMILQAWIADPSTPMGLASSNGLIATTP